MAGPPRYWAFLSYSDRDRVWARWLQRALESYVVPRRFVGRPTAAGPATRRLRPIFRDRTEMEAGSDLSVRLKKALADSAFLIVLCSPDAARSYWVEQEIRLFRDLHGDERILSVIVAGHTAGPHDDCFPPALRDHGMPVAADLRTGGDGRRLTRLKLIAGMLGVGLDELVRRDAQRRHAQVLGLAGGAFALAIAMGGLAIAALLARNQAIAARDEARARRVQAEGLVEFMVGDLYRTLEPTVRLGVLGEVGDRAMAYYSAEARYGMDDDSLGRRAGVLRILGKMEDDRGHTDAALSLWRQAAAATGELLRRAPDNPQRLLEHAQSIERLGGMAEERAELPQALALMEEYARLADRLVARGGAKDAYLAEQGSAHVDLGVVLLQTQRLEEATAALRSGLAIKRAVAARDPGGRQGWYDVAQSLAWLADAERLQGQDDASLHDRGEEARLYVALLARSPDDWASFDSLLVNRIKQAQILLDEGSATRAVTLSRQAAADAERLARVDPTDTTFKADIGRVYLVLGQASLAVGQTRQARSAAERAESLGETLVRTDPTVTAWRGPLLGGARLLLVEIEARHAHGEDACRRALAPAAAESEQLDRLSAASPTLPPLALTAARGDLLRGELDAAGGRMDQANADWVMGVDRLERVGGEHGEPSDTASRRLYHLLRSRTREESGGPVAASERDAAMCSAIGSSARPTQAHPHIASRRD
ncbi:MAG: toll/interleukin receptor protein [Caulobacteraceae bacterium]|nr:toll/interleukin receptor protein [Caulobacteraceae bacterium]